MSANSEATTSNNSATRMTLRPKLDLPVNRTKHQQKVASCSTFSKIPESKQRANLKKLKKIIESPNKKKSEVSKVRSTIGGIVVFHTKNSLMSVSLLFFVT